MARAHVGDLIDTLDVVSTPQGPAVEGTFGLIPTNSAGDLVWVCHEAVTAEGAVTAPDYTRSPSGIWAARMPDVTQARDGKPVWVSEDLCDWTAVEGLDGRTVADVAFAPDGTLWVATADATGDNAVLAGPDASSLSPVLTRAGTRFLSIEVGAGLWVTSSEGDTALTLWHSEDGQTFTERAIPVPPDVQSPVDATVGVAHPSDPTRAWIVLDPVGEDRLVGATDAGDTLETLWLAPERITDLERTSSGAIYATLGDRRPWRVSEGAGEPVDPIDLTELADAGGITSDANQTLFLANRSFVNGLFLTESIDGTTATRTAPPSAITGPLTCPADSDQMTVCGPLWDSLSPRLQPVDTADTGRPPIDTDPDLEPPDDRSEGCGCHASAAFPGGVLLLLATIAMSRRASRPRG